MEIIQVSVIPAVIDSHTGSQPVSYQYVIITV